MTLSLANTGKATTVLHVYDRLRLDAVPRRYTVGPGQRLEDAWPAGAHDLWVLGPNGFHRRFVGEDAGVELTARAKGGALLVTVTNTQAKPRLVTIEAQGQAPWRATFKGVGTQSHAFPTTQGWYDLTARLDGEATWLRRLAGRVETGKDSISDPLMGGGAILSL
jgi:phospholipase C